MTGAVVEAPGRRPIRQRLPAPVGSAEAARRGMRWLYLLIALTLSSTGAGAGQLIFMANDLGHLADVDACLVDRGQLLDGPAARVSADGWAGFTECVAPYNAGHGWAMLIGAVAVPLTAWCCLVQAGLLVRRRLRRSAVEIDGPRLTALATRFDHWCDALRLPERDRPTLVVGRVGRHTRRAFTTSMPLRRPLMMIPYAYAYLPQEQVDLVLLHELAHVRARDLTWASASWWSGRLAVPLLVVALAPMAARPRVLLAQFGAMAAVTVVLSVLTLVLRTAVLRRREQSADRFAAARGGCLSALAAAAGAGSAAPPSWRARLRGLLAHHPAPAQRAVAAWHADEGWPGGFVVAAAAGVLAMFTYQCLVVLLLDVSRFAWSDPRLSGDLALGIAASAWAAAVVPLWAGRDVAGSRRRWWSRAAGSVLGLVAGYHLQPTGTAAPVTAQLFGEQLPGSVGWSVVVMAAGTVVALGLAEALSAVGGGRLRRRGATVAAVVGTATALSLAISVSSFLLIGYATTGSAAGVRNELVGGGQIWWWQWAPAVVLGCAGAVLAGGVRNRTGRAAVAVVAARLLPRPAGTVVAVATLGLAAASSVLVRSRLPHAVDDDSVLLLLHDRIWMCAVAGTVAWLAVLARARPPAGHPAALIAPALITGSACAGLGGLAQFVRDAATGPSGRNLDNLVALVRMPVWLFLILALLTAPGAMLWAARRGGGAPDPARRSKLVALAVAAGTVVPAVLISNGVTAPVTGAPDDRSRGLAMLDRITASAPVLTTVDGGPTTVTGTRTGRVLTAQAAAALLSAVQQGMPRPWQSAPNIADTAPESVRPPACADRMAAERIAEQRRGQLADETVTMTVPPASAPPLGLTMALGITSYRSPDSAREALAETTAVAGVCRQFTLPAGHGDARQHVTVTVAPTTRAGHPGLLLRLTDTGTVRSRPFVVGQLTEQVAVGHNVVSAEVTVAYPFHDRLNTEQSRQLDDLADLGLSRTIRALA